MVDFVPGIELSESFYVEVVRPALEGVRHSAALIGNGSQVLGYDTARSTDHGWGACVLVFLEDSAGDRPEVETPESFHGHPVLWVRFLTVGEFIVETLGVDPSAPIEPADWVTFTGQSLLEITRGKVFHDGLGTLEPARRRFADYPEDVWRYLLAAQWCRISQEEHLVGRAADVGDETGSRIIGARLVRDLMRLGFLLERTYAPYPKWFGTAFRELAIAETLSPPLDRILDAAAWPEREAALVEAYEIVAERQNALGIGPEVPATASGFHDRPFRVIHGERFMDSIRSKIRDEAVLALPEHLGAADQMSDSTDLLSYPALRVRLRSLYGR